MKVLVYGIGVIGSLTVHELIAAGNDVTVIARGTHKDTLEKDGLCLKIHKKIYADHPRVLPAYDGQDYDIVFSVMQNQQQDALLETLAGIRTKNLVLVGNNMESGEMDRILREKSSDGKKIFFGFQTSAGQKQDGYTEAVIFGAPVLTLGHLKAEPDSEEKEFFRKLFKNSAMKFEFMDDMEAWYRCHAAFIIPIAAISYTHHCDIRTCGRRDVADYLTAGGEAYDFLQSIGVPIRPNGDEKNLHGIRGGILFAAMWIVVKTKLGEDCVTNHCRHAVAEMQFMDEKFEELRRQNSSFPMPVYDRLRKERPSWEELHREYDT